MRARGGDEALKPALLSPTITLRSWKFALWNTLFKLIPQICGATLAPANPHPVVVQGQISLIISLSSPPSGIFAEDYEQFRSARRGTARCGGVHSRQPARALSLARWVILQISTSLPDCRLNLETFPLRSHQSADAPPARPEFTFCHLPPQPRRVWCCLPSDSFLNTIEQMEQRQSRLNTQRLLN